MRSVVFRVDDLAAFGRMLGGEERELPLPNDQPVGEGDWVLAIFEIGTRKRATAAAARGHTRADGPAVLSFERRDWDRLRSFALGGARAPRHRGPEADVTPPRSEPPVSEREGPETQRDSATTVSLSTSGHHVAAAARVLVVDDDRAICEVVSAMLETVGLLVATVPSAEEAIERVKTREFQLVVLDWNLPGMTGLELCKLIRGEPELGTLPVLFLTANTSQKDLVDAFASGADDYVLKPFRAPELGARIFGLLRRARMSRAREKS